MITWATDYWYLCLAAFIIGVITAAWIWLRARANVELSADIDEPRITAPSVTVPLEPVKPTIDVAEPVAFVAPTPAPVAAPVAGRPNIAAAVGDPDDLTLIKGVGPKLNALLISLGITRFDQIAAWGASEIGEVDGYLGNFKGRIARDSWVEQAGLLARGDLAGFAAKFGELGSENKPA
jgi:predicted flap endonuclease-1-like 5' DNA nuclease